MPSSSSYPYSRAEECSWQPEEVARQLSSLGGGNVSTDSSHLLMQRGWSSGKVAALRRMYGSNTMIDDEQDQPTSTSVVVRMFPCMPAILTALYGQLKEPLILMLLSSAGLSLVLGNTADAVSIGVALLVVSLVATVQEYRSEAALEKLAHLVPHTCTVLRDGRVLDGFLAKELVVGDLVLLGTGDRVPADCRVVDSVELMLDESSLTGESHPVSKTGEGVTLPSTISPLTQQYNIVFCGTLVRGGRGRALVVAVGEGTEFGKIHVELSTVASRKSPSKMKMDELGQRLVFGSMIAVGIIAVLGWLMGRPFLETVTVAVSLAVAAIPEGLPICITVTLALGVLRMARMNVIVKKLPAVESLGCVTVMASDKTGTLTQNEMTARSVYTLAFPTTNFGFTGVGYDPSKGELVRDAGDKNRTYGEPKHLTSDSEECGALSALFGVASLCNNATLEGGSSGQPTELSLLVASEKGGVSDPRPMYHRVQEIPFTSDRKRMEVKARPVGGIHACPAFTLATQRPPKSGRRSAPRSEESLYFVKGMPESVVVECSSHINPDGSTSELTEESKTRALSQSRRMAASGLRVLAMAYGPTLEDLIFAGLIGMEDPPREGVADAVLQLRQGGVKVLMFTGDSKETALAIARRCGIYGEEHDRHVLSPAGGLDGSFESELSGGLEDVELGARIAMSGEELDSLPPNLLVDSIKGVRIFYRVDPRHRLSLIRVLQLHGEIVAMTGEGVNDVTALKGADIGIVMGKGGTDVAKEAADVVLADDDFSIITKAIKEGKGILFNIRNFLSFQLSSSFAVLTMASIATACGLPSPLNAMQILWINIIMDGPPAQSLGVEPVDEKILSARPRNADDPVVTQALLARAITSAALIVYLTLKVFHNELDDGQVTRRDTTMTFMTFVNCDLMNAYVCRSSSKCFYEMSIFCNPTFIFAIGGSIIGQLLVIYFPPLQEVFQTEALTFHDMVYIICLSSLVLWLDTLRKKFFASWFSDAYHASPLAAKKDDDVHVPRRKPWLNFRQLDTPATARRKKSGAVRNRNISARTVFSELESFDPESSAKRTEFGSVMTRGELEKQRKTRGECLTCGRKCFQNKLSR